MLAINRWFDDLPERKRFIVFAAGIAFPLSVLGSYDPILGSIACVVLMTMRLYWFRVSHRQ